ncbi:MAG: nucleotidyltransferase family protein [Chloroflexota bacterium]|nr:nucleotidyltransferase family protein [Chloroflexota bacterium]
MKAMILAAGEGTRLRPMTIYKPKVLLPIGDVPLIHRTLLWLKRFGITDVAMNLHHLGDAIQNDLHDGSDIGMRITYSQEEVLLGTSGGVRRMKDYFGATFAVIYGDVYTNLNLQDMVAFHKSKGAIATLAVSERPNPWELAIVQLDKEGRIIHLIEKPPASLNVGNLANGGVYILEPAILNYIPSEGSSDFGYDIFPNLLNLKESVYAYVLGPQEYLVDIGTPKGYHQANQLC